ncbi:MAG: thiamine phosphate synthase [Thermoanaerobaculia bacterium]
MRAFAIANVEAPPTEELFARIRRLAAAGVDRVLLRDPTRPDAERYRTALRLRGLLAPPAALMVHGRPDLALAAAADGVHLPATGMPVGAVRRLFPNGIVGRACHSVEDCRAAAGEGAEYVLLGPIFAPRSKAGEARIGREDLARAARLSVDVYALGGISPANLGALQGLGLAGVAGITLFMADEPLEAVVEAVRRS